MEYWFDPRHTGAIRVIDKQRQIIHGSDPNEPLWEVTFECLDAQSIRVDFSNKRTHHGRRVMTAHYAQRRSRLMWPDSNVWLRIRVSPRKLIRHVSKSPSQSRSR